MGVINILDAQTANMIAAGEVVDRPASALKELLENALDAGATKIFVDIKGGGRVFLRVTDNGSGFFRDDMPKALLRHATSKIATGEDLTAIGTFGFRGEALAAIGSVSRMEIISRQRSETVGTRLTSDENGVVMEDTGCPEGTSVVVRDLFYNTPARQKFLKRDATEASACVTAAEHAALSHPEVSFTVSVDGERRFYTAGDGKLLTAIHSIYGKEFSSGLLPVEETMDGVHVFGYVTAPDHARGSRAMQLFFVNSRPVRSRTILAALEEAFKSFLPHGRYPGAVLFVELPLRLTDVNVHPAKLEIRFADERTIFSAVYYTVRNRLAESPSAEEQTEQEFDRKTVEVSDRTEEKGEETPIEQKQPEQVPAGRGPEAQKPETSRTAGTESRTPFRADIGLSDLPADDQVVFTDRSTDPAEPESGQEADAENGQTVLEDGPYWKYIGEAYDAFLFMETEDTVYVVDKHAAHERILYERIASRKEVHSQTLLTAIPVDLSSEECVVLTENSGYLSEFGFDLEPFGGNTVLIRAVPASLADTRRLPALLQTFASELAAGGNIPFSEKCDRALFTVACKAAVKAGIPNNPAHNEWILEQLMTHHEIRFCPHGRPVMHPISKREIEKFFDR